MTTKAFVDANVLVYAHDARAGSKHIAARTLVERLWEGRSGVVSTQVLQEFYVNVRRKVERPLTATEARQALSEYLRWHLIVNSGASILSAIDVEQRFQLSFWDALIVQAAQTAGVATLYSEDLADGQRYGSVTVVNPFAERGDAG